MTAGTSDYFSPQAFERLCTTSGLSGNQIAKALRIKPSTLRELIGARASPSLALLRRATTVLGGTIADYLSLPLLHDWDLTDLRLSRGYSQREVAESLGVSQAAVANWEAGKHKPALDVVAKLVALYGVPEQRILGCIERTAGTADSDRKIAQSYDAALASAEEILSLVDGTGDAEPAGPEWVRREIYSRTMETLAELGNLIPRLPPVPRTNAHGRFRRLEAVLQQLDRHRPR